MTADQSTGQLVSYWDWHELRPVAGTVPASHRRNTGKYYETSRENTGNSALTTKLYTAGNYHFNTITITLGKVWYFVNVLLLRNLSFYKIQGKLKRRMMVIKIGIDKVGLYKKACLVGTGRIFPSLFPHSLVAAGYRPCHWSHFNWFELLSSWQKFGRLIQWNENN